jgi:hypothetical protein
MSGNLGPYLLGPNDVGQGIVRGDLRILGDFIPDESVDMVFTDPPWAPVTHSIYGDIARLASRVLKPRGFCAVYCGVAYMDEVMEQMASSMDYFWTICGYQPESNLVYNSKNVGCHWRPILLYSKGPARAPRFISDVWRTNRDKAHHEWGQGESLPTRYIDRLTRDGDIVLDPCVGGGTIPVVCKILGRRWLAFDIDQTAVDEARRNVLETQPPLFVLQAEQMEF